MKKFDFTIYKSTRQYFLMYDVLIKEKVPNRDNFLIDNDIPPSSYRRCKASEQHGGREIVDKLAKVLKLKTNTLEEIDEIEKFASKVYYQMTYKIFKSYYDDIEYIKKLLFENNILFPILELLLLFLYMNENKKASDIINDNMELYKKIKKYNSFFTSELKELYELVIIFFKGGNKEELYLKTYENAIAYTILSGQSYNKGDYIACLYFSNKAKEISEKEGNIRRIIRLNRNIMLCLLYIGNYEECYELASRQILILESLEIEDNSLELAYKVLMVASVGCEKYEKVIQLIENKSSINLTEITCLLIAYFNTNKKKYDNYLKNRLNYFETDKTYLKYINGLNVYLKKPDKKHLEKLEHSEIMAPMKKIFKKMLRA